MSSTLKGCSKQLAFVHGLRGLSLFLCCFGNLPFSSVQTYLFTGEVVTKELFSVFTCVMLYWYREVFTVLETVIRYRSIDCHDGQKGWRLRRTDLLWQKEREISREKLLHKLREKLNIFNFSMVSPF